MTVDLSGRPIVADAQLVMSEMGYRVFSYGWDGAAWQRPAPGIAGAPPPQVYVRTPKIAVDRNGGLVAAWLHASPSVSAIAVARYQP